MKAVIQKRGDGGNHHPQVISGKQEDINTATIKFKPFCTHCGEELIEDQFYIGGHGYVWALHCPNYHCPDKWPNGMPLTIELPTGGEGTTI